MESNKLIVTQQYPSSYYGNAAKTDMSQYVQNFKNLDLMPPIFKMCPTMFEIFQKNLGLMTPIFKI
jgi:hypothetical protein